MPRKKQADGGGGGDEGTANVTQVADVDSNSNMSMNASVLPEKADLLSNLYVMSEDELAQLEKTFEEKIKLQVEGLKKSSELMDALQADATDVAQTTETNGSGNTSNKMAKFMSLNKSLEKLKEDMDRMLQQREDAQHNLEQLANKMVADHKLIEEEQKKLEESELSKENELYEKHSGICVTHETSSKDSGENTTVVKVAFPDLATDDHPVYVKLKASGEASSARSYEEVCHEPRLEHMSDLMGELNNNENSWETFTRKLRESFETALNKK